MYPGLVADTHTHTHTHTHTNTPDTQGPALDHVPGTKGPSCPPGPVAHRDLLASNNSATSLHAHTPASVSVVPTFPARSWASSALQVIHEGWREVEGDPPIIRKMMKNEIPNRGLL